MTPEVVWIAEETAGFAEGTTRGCAPVATEVRLPKGLRGSATPAREACGPDWMFVRFETPGFRQDRPNGWYVPTASLTKAPPRVGADAWKPTGTAFVRGAGDDPTVGLFVDDPSWTAPALFLPGEPVEVLAPGLVRSASGREVWLDTFFVVAEDPLAKTFTAGARESVPLWRRLQAGRPAREKAGPLATLPTSDTLTKAPKGQPFAFQIRTEWLRDPTFSPEWLDPVGHTLEHTCKETPRELEPCGRYLLDYTPFGAWLPERDTDVIAVWDGRRLVVQVIDPWGERVEVSPAWDGAASP